MWTIRGRDSIAATFAATAFQPANHTVSPPTEWARTVRELTDLPRIPVPPSSWWATNPIFGADVETRTEPEARIVDAWDGHLSEEPKAFCLQIGLAGWGECCADGSTPKIVAPGKAFFSLHSSPQRSSLPAKSPGFVFAWVTAQHPYLAARVAKQVAATGPLVDVRPDDPLVASALRLVRGARRRDFRDRFEAEIALVELVVAFERWAQGGREVVSEGQRLVDDVRSFVLARLPKAIDVRALAAEFGMGRSKFSTFFREQTGLTPAHFATDVRLQKAADMLIDTREPLKVIADACGFASANQLGKVFRRLRYINPSTLRQGRRKCVGKED